jgi:shikimate dehydrogenase
MHHAAYDALGLAAQYDVYDVPPDALAAAVDHLRKQRVAQLSVSIPHKLAILPFLDEVESTAREIGAVNTIVAKDGAWLGSNTDWRGAMRALERETELEGKRAVVLGAGGAARALVYGLTRCGARVWILNRTPEKAAGLARDLGAAGHGPLEALGETAHDILVNTTSVGLGSDESPVAAAAISRRAVVMDAVYEPIRTQLLRDAARRGARTITGKWMLVYQAALQLEAWAEVVAPIEAMAAAFDAAGKR